MVGRCPAFDSTLPSHCIYAEINKPTINKFDLAFVLNIPAATVEKRAEDAMIAVRTFTEAYYAVQDIQREGEPEPVPEQLQEEIYEVWKGSYLQHFHIIDEWVVYRFLKSKAARELSEYDEGIKRVMRRIKKHEEETV